MIKKCLWAAIVATFMTSCAGGRANYDNNTATDNEMTTSSTATDAVVKLETTAGDITLKLFGDTPAHRDNFLKLVKDGYYDGTLFHRVIKDFMIQGGDPDSRTATKGQMLGSGGPDYTIEAEIIYPAHFHKRGALAAARQGDQVNPEKRSSGSQFYIVTGKVYSDSTLRQLSKQLEAQKINEVFQRLRMEYRDKIMELSRANDQAALETLRDQMIAQAESEAKGKATLTDEQIEVYSTVGGTPHLDGAYTVFGEVLEGMDVVDKIQNVPTDRADRPEDDVKIIKATVVE